MKKYITREGLELKYRQIKAQEEKVREIGKEVGEEAGINCDWHDNFGYEDAKRRLEIESTILKRLMDEIDGAVTVTIHEQAERVMMGVTIKILIDGNKKEFTIGAFGESDPGNGLIAYNSPLANSLFGMKRGDFKTVKIGGKEVEIEIVDIFPPSYRYNHLMKQLLSEVPGDDKSRASRASG